MRCIDVQGRFRSSKVLVGERLQNAGHYAPAGKTIVVSDVQVARLYGEDFPPGPRIVLESGEKAKTLDTVRAIYRDLLDRGADRTSFLLGIGGGVICDLTGFAAGTYMRGLGFGFVPTTLLAQVDAAIGGKNGVDLDGYKNIVGLFRQPEFVLCDPLSLRTLNETDLANGFAEVIKHGLIGDPALLTLLENRHADALALEPELMTRIIHDSIAVKAGVVGRDEEEAGERKILNFGHTLAHALEKTSGLPHGRAVAIGIVLALRLSWKKGLLKSRDIIDRVIRLLRAFGLPVAFEGDPLPVFEAMAKDKKKSGATLDLVLLRDIGVPCLHPIPLSSLKEECLDLCQSA